MIVIPISSCLRKKHRKQLFLFSTNSKSRIGSKKNLSISPDRKGKRTVVVLFFAPPFSYPDDIIAALIL